MNKIISDDEMLLLLAHKYQYIEQKYQYETDKFGTAVNEKISIFKDWIRLFQALRKLKLMCNENKNIDENALRDSEQLREVFISLHINNSVTLGSKYVIRFELFHIFKSCLEEYDKTNGWNIPNNFLNVLSLYVDKRLEFPIQECLIFYSIFKNKLVLTQLQSCQMFPIQRQLMDAQNEIFELYRRYGGLYSFNVTYHLEINLEVTSEFEFTHQFKELSLIKQQILSDKGLLKVLFNLENDGINGCLLNCILIYPLQLYLNINKTLAQLEIFAKNCIEGTQINFINNQWIFEKIFEEDIFGKINTIQKLNNFLYWSVGCFYRYNAFFSYDYPSTFDIKINYEKILTPWSLSLKHIQTGFVHRLVNIDQIELFKAIKDSKEVWSTSALDKGIQKKFNVDQIVLLEVPYELDNIKNLNGEILHIIQIFDTHLRVSKEPFFFFDRFKDVIIAMQISQIGQQLIYLVNLFSQRPHLLNDLKLITSIFSTHLLPLFESMLWQQIEQLANKGSIVLTSIEILNGLNKLRGSYRPDQLSARSSSLPSISSRYTVDDLLIFHRRNKEAQKYVEELLKEDLLICRLKFYADVEGGSFVDQKEIFSKHFTEFLRVNKRSNLLKVLKGYFLIWLPEVPQYGFIKQERNKPYIDIIFMMECSHSFNIQEFWQQIHTEWGNYLGKKPTTPESEISFKTKNLICDVVMHSEELLNSKLIRFRKRDLKLKKVLLEKLVTYFTYRHFYFPKLYEDKANKKVKMFSKGS